MFDHLKNLYYFRYMVKIFNLGTPSGFRLYVTAKECLGIDASPNDRAPDELGCAETVNNIVFKVFGDYAGGDLSTIRMYHSIKNNIKFIQVRSPLPGDIILTPTESPTKIGHVGIMGYGGKIMSNRSETGRFEDHLNLDSWNEKYKDFQILFFRRVFGRSL